MQDLTLNEKDKKNYITHILIDRKRNKYKEIYADGTIKLGLSVSKENYQMYLNKMEEQYYQYQEIFKKERQRRIWKETKKQFLTLCFSLLGLYLDYILDIHVLMKMIFFFLIICGGFLLSYFYKDEIKEMKVELKKVEVMDYFLMHQEEFASCLSLNTMEQYLSITGLKNSAIPKDREEIYLTLK